jgi:hypothetical protein
MIGLVTSNAFGPQLFVDCSFLRLERA